MWKRSGRIMRWNNRYFTLEGSRIQYKYKPDGPMSRTYDLTRGCVVREVVEEIKAGKKIYCFWVIWPELDEETEMAIKGVENKGGDFETHTGSGRDPNFGSGSDTEKEKDREGRSRGRDAKGALTEGGPSGGVKDGADVRSVRRESNGGAGRDFKKIVESEVKSQRTLQKIAEQELEKHEIQDNNVSMGVKVAAVAVGGVVVGALTAGIGLVPYITVVGLTAVASGGAVALQYKRPSDSRLVLACDTMADALEWKHILELQIAKLERDARGVFIPPAVDVVNILSMTAASNQGYIRTSVHEGICILERRKKVGAKGADTGYANPASNESSEKIDVQICKKAQAFFANTPISIFLCLMTVPSPVKTFLTEARFDLEVISIIDDHSDVVKLTVYNLPWKNARVVTFFLSRFWKLDDDGSYLITFNSVDVEKWKERHGNDNHLKGIDSADLISDVIFDAVYTISPRRDHMEYDVDLLEALVNFTAQVTFSGKTSVEQTAFGSEANARVFLDEFLRQLSNFREHLALAKFRDETSNVKDCSSVVDVTCSSSAVDLRDVSFGERSFGDSAHDLSLLASLDDALHHRGRLDSTDSMGLPIGSDTTTSARVRPSRHRRFRGLGREGNDGHSHLRSVIAAKEYEIKRLENDMRLRSSEEDQGGSDKGELQQKLEKEQTELKDLKAKYEESTGTEYYAMGSRSDLDAIAMEAAALNQENPGGGDQASAAPRTRRHKRTTSRIPSFWMRSDRDTNVIIQRHGSSTSIGYHSLVDRGSPMRNNLVTLLFTCGLAFVLYISDMVI